jgi:S-DNA-T family DNA segregation ATPase FtsK/SpoIIIE
VQVTQGPTVTRYEIQPSSGTKLSKIVGLADDIALNLAVSTVLIAPVPGKAATVGVEIPNTNVTPVTIREMLSSAEFQNAKSKLTVCLGKDIGGNVIVSDIAK